MLGITTSHCGGVDKVEFGYPYAWGTTQDSAVSFTRKKLKIVAFRTWWEKEPRSENIKGRKTENSHRLRQYTLCTILILIPNWEVATPKTEMNRSKT